MTLQDVIKRNQAKCHALSQSIKSYKSIKQSKGLTPYQESNFEKEKVDYEHYSHIDSALIQYQHILYLTKEFLDENGPVKGLNEQ